MATNVIRKLRRIEPANGNEFIMSGNEFMTNSNEKILYKELSYKLQGLFFDIRNDLGSGHKESIYQKALEKELVSAGIKFVKEPSIKIYLKKGEFLGLYRPDFLIEEKIIVELKAVENISRQEIARVYDYLRNSEYEIAYLVNFASPRLFIKRLIFTNDRKSNPRIATNIIILFVAISFLFVGIRGVKAASLYFESPATKVGIGQEFIVNLILDTETESINAVEGKIIFPSDLITVKDINDGNTIISLWIQKPTPENDQITFSGIIPGGYNSNQGKMFSIRFQVIKEGGGIIQVAGGKTLLNDGKGTSAKLLTGSFSFVAIREPIRDYSWTIEDREPPESFVPEIAKDETLFDGKWFAVFATQDKISGIDHYEIREAKQWTRFENLLPFVKYFRRHLWTVAESPHVLADQELRSFIWIKAVDKAGNARVERILPQNPLRWYENYENWVMMIVVIISIFVIQRTLWKKLLTHK